MTATITIEKWKQVFNTLKGWNALGEICS